MRFDKLIKPILIIAAFGALLWTGINWFGDRANNDLSDYDGGRGSYESAIEQ